MKWMWATALFLALAFGACGGDDAGDVVVGVVVKCMSAGREVQGSACDSGGPIPPGQQRQELTVRTPDGGIYTVSVPREQRVKVGDRWPPK